MSLSAGCWDSQWSEAQQLLSPAAWGRYFCYLWPLSSVSEKDGHRRMSERADKQWKRERESAEGAASLPWSEGSCLFREPLVGWSRRWLSLESSLGQDGLRALQKESWALWSLGVLMTRPRLPSAENVRFCLQPSLRTWTSLGFTWHFYSESLAVLGPNCSQCQFLACWGLQLFVPKPKVRLFMAE